MQRLSVDQFLQDGATILDVRSPAEYKQGHIPGAVSLPLFSDEERKIVGTIYKQQGKHDAFKAGMDFVGTKMVDFVNAAEAYGNQAIHIYCWRGGMRSGSMGWLLSQASYSVSLLDGGYKQYRRQMISAFEQDLDLRVLSGLTGSGKTEVLKSMIELGAQVLDLEALANHQGSSFGNVLSTHQPTTEQFQNDLYQALAVLDRKRPIWLEDESIFIGKVHLPDPLFAQMQASDHYVVDVSMDQRLDLLVSDYGHLDIDALRQATDNITKKLGHQNATRVHEALDAKDLRGSAEILLTYYDRRYKKSIQKKEDKVKATIDGRAMTHLEIAKKIIETHGY